MLSPLTFAGLIAQRAAEKPDLGVLTIEGVGKRPDDVRSYRQLWANGRTASVSVVLRGNSPYVRARNLLGALAEEGYLNLEGSRP